MFKVISNRSAEYQEIMDRAHRFNTAIAAVRKCLSEGGHVILKTNMEVIPLTDTKLKTMQGVVGGLIEVTGCILFPNMELVVNEEGRIVGLPFNEIAAIASGQPIFGDAILLPVGAIR